MTDRDWMRRALRLAERGAGAVSPNPMVGAVIVDRDGELLGEGYHASCGGPHAEAAALSEARRRGRDPRGATMFLTLEPCVHQGRQPPCAPAIVAAGIARLVIAIDDPSEKAAGKGPAILAEAGVEVEWLDGVEAEAARTLTRPFRKHARTGKPLVIFKSAAGLDGRTTSAGGESKWISGERSRRLVHRWRGEVDAVAVGIGTALADDPLLTARDPEPPRRAARIVFDRGARLPLRSALVGSVDLAPVIVIAGPDSSERARQQLRSRGVEVIVVGEPDDRWIGAALGALGDRPLTSLLLEGGAALAGAFRDADEIDEARLFYAPILLGGVDARPMLAGTGVAAVADAGRATNLSWEPCGDDLLVQARMREW